MQLDDVGLLVLRILAFSLGLYVVIGLILSAIRSFVLPRAAQVLLIRWTFLSMRGLFNLRAGRATSYAERDRIMALYAPVSLFIVAIVLLTLLIIGYALIYWSLGGVTALQAFRISGSSLLTLGNATDERLLFQVLEFSEAMVGLLMVALLIAYLPTMYSGFTRREVQVVMLETRAGSPPSPWELINRSYRNGELTQLRSFWSDWQAWFAELEESHTSLPALSFFRSPRPELSWVTAAGTVLDSAALMLSTVDVAMEPRAAFCIRSGFLALRQIASFFGVEYDRDPSPGDPISISRFEYDEVCGILEAAGIPLRVDREQAWRDFSGWRVNYDTVLIALAALTMAPYAPWSSDRSLAPTAGLRRARAGM